MPKGYHNGSGKVTGPTLASLVSTNVTLADANYLLKGYTAYGKNGVKYTGTNQGYTNGYNSGRTQGQTDVKNSPNSYSLYTKSQYDANYNNGYSAARSSLKATGMSGMEWKGSAGTKECTYSIPAGTRQVIVICSAGYGNGAQNQSSQQYAWCDIQLSPAATSAEAVITNNSDRGGNVYAYATIAYKYNLNGSATTITVQHNVSGYMLYFSSMVVYV